MPGLEADVVLRIAANAGAVLALGLAFIDPPGRLCRLAGAGLALLAAASLLGFVGLEASELRPDARAAALGDLLTTTWNGRIAALRVVVLIVAAGLLAAGRRSLALCAILACQALASIGGHAASAEPQFLSFIMHGMHAAAASLWAGSAAILFLASSDRDAIARFSARAPFLVLIVVAGGLGAGALQAGSVPALIGTTYGQLLLLKAVLLAGALAAAAWLRWRYLATAGSSPRLALAVETLALASILAAAGALSQTPPGRHAEIAWPFAFRFAPEVALTTPDALRDALAWTGFAIAGAALSLLLAVNAKRREAAIALICAGACGALGFAASTVPATPATYRFSPVSFEATSVARGTALFRAHCVECHGETGHGDGPILRGLDITQADLTQAHTKDHTMGDLFWQIGHGSRNELMPGFADKIDEEGRWDLVNYVRALAQGHAATALRDDIEPGKPWLASIDFGYVDEGGRYRSLWETEGKATLLVIARDPEARPRLTRLAAAAAEFRAAGLRPIAVLPEDSGLRPEDAPGFDTVTTGTEPIVAAWTHYRRTAANPDEDDAEPYVSEVEFLIDRFGYVRARWRSDEGWFFAPSLLVERAGALAGEPQLLPPPAEHIH